MLLLRNYVMFLTAKHPLALTELHITIKLQETSLLNKANKQIQNAIALSTLELI